MDYNPETLHKIPNNKNTSLQSSEINVQISSLNQSPECRSGMHLPLPLTNLHVLPHTYLKGNPNLPAFEYISGTNLPSIGSEFPLLELSQVGMLSAFIHRRPRGEKRPIPDEQKDEKYYERRKRNNEAAKKSRDARKIREDRIAFRAALLEQENSILRAQVVALRDELQALRQFIGTTTTSIINRTSA
ncbi:uncharacterized protein LOC119674521 [Teleopsis dalmanni]|uniref:uncharacterized protein LOC119674521 n=1 Tax=Teleopsis dalmanni TaxID=139649 RepID=UPI0018CF6070|nr:uncharacterized protein LOC119674521 [Teleopsis dalmanni]